MRLAATLTLLSAVAAADLFPRQVDPSGGLGFGSCVDLCGTFTNMRQECLNGQPLRQDCLYFCDKKDEVNACFDCASKQGIDVSAIRSAASSVCAATPTSGSSQSGQAASSSTTAPPTETTTGSSKETSGSSTDTNVGTSPTSTTAQPTATSAGPGGAGSSQDAKSAGTPTAASKTGASGVSTSSAKPPSNGAVAAAASRNWCLVLVFTALAFLP